MGFKMIIVKLNLSCTLDIYQKLKIKIHGGYVPLLWLHLYDNITCTRNYGFSDHK